MTNTLHASEAKKLSQEYQDTKEEIFTNIKSAAEKGENYINVDIITNNMKVLLEELGYVISSNYEEDCYTIEW